MARGVPNRPDAAETSDSQALRLSMRPSGARATERVNDFETVSSKDAKHGIIRWVACPYPMTTLLIAVAALILAVAARAALDPEVARLTPLV